MRSSNAGSAKIQAICHDRRCMISGEILDASEWGCELRAYPAGASGPAFPRKTNVLLSLVDESTGRTMNIQARLTGVARKDGTWTYRIRWEGLPELLKAG